VDVFLEKLAARVPPTDFEIWFRQTPCEHRPPSTFVLTTQNHFRCKWIRKEFGGAVREVATEILGGAATVEFEVESADPSASAGASSGASAHDEPLDAPDETGRRESERSAKQQPVSLDSVELNGTVDEPAELRNPSGGSPLNRELALESFVVGVGSRVAFAAATAVAEFPGKTYNPFCLYGPSGVGKTHLLQGVARQLLRTTNLRTLYTTGEAFTNAYVDAAARNELDKFHGRCLDQEVLIVDDLQFLSGKERTLESFLHVFSSLIAERRQIVFACDQNPDELPSFPERLISGFRAGLTTPIEPPVFETRVAILTQKARQRGRELPLVTAEYLAQQVSDNVRELEGALLRLLAITDVHRSPLSVDTAELAVRELDGRPSTPRAVTVEAIVDAVVEYYDVCREDLLSPSKVRSVVHARQVGMFLARELTGLSLEQIGVGFGGRDHSTVVYANRCVRKRAASRVDIRTDLKVLRSRIRAILRR